ncbi:uncharacterized protein MKZ38_003402 [Zalerion maritima]|uniref:Uncharacterized protein n=1 Tax=Zalerion maritima TaxID=339359 RepID=A0AAD5RUG0_9PEZI|nr:uncharacterized protein MKZ38_003402 [Zalerion maritima]
MSAAIAMAPSPAPHDRPFPAELPPPAPTSSAAATATASPSAHRSLAPIGTPSSAATYRSGSGSPRGRGTAASAPQKSSPPSSSRCPGPKIVVKKEPGSPDLPAPRHRPRKLDLSKNTLAGPQTARPAIGRDGLNVQEVGIACLSPGFVTKDPVMQEQLQRSMSVREQQRHIIEARLQQQSAKGPGDMDKDKDGSGFPAKTPGFSRRNKAPGLSIVAPSHEHFANERVIQSAPLGQTFTGMHKPQPLSRHIANQPPSMSNQTHIHHVPATQTTNRLPPISDVFGKNLSGQPEPLSRPSLYPQSSHAPLASPGHPPPPHAPMSATRPRDYRSAEEAQQELAGGRPELLPKLVHYAGAHPPTPPSPMPSGQNADGLRSGRRRTRAEYEDGGSPPLGTGPAPRRGPFGEGRDSPESQRKKREEFLRLCERAWDLFHS